jgi:RDD family protein
MSKRAHRSSVGGDHFEVAPAVAGLPLASHFSRAMAMLVDLAVIAAPSLAIRSPIAPAAVLVAAIVYRHSGSWTAGRWKGTVGLASRRAISFAILALGLAAGEVWKSSHRKDPKHSQALQSQLARNSIDLAKIDAAMTGLARVEQMAPTSLKQLGETRQALAELRDSAGVGGAESDTREPEEVRRLRSQNLVLAQQVEVMQKELKEAHKDRGILHFLKVLAHDLGIGLGWSALYFIVFPVLWNGRTPGKRLMRIRVARLNGKPISWWNAFERFHGYVSCLLGGLIGFLQVLWDPQSQGHHDKVAETVVVKDLPIPIALPVESSQVPRTA